MASTRSVYSGSPVSKSTLDTPDNGPYDNFFSLTTPTDLRLSPGEDSYPEWKALPSRLLESPSPGVSAIQLHNHPVSVGKLAGGMKVGNKLDPFDLDEALGNQALLAPNTRANNSIQQTFPSRSTITQQYLGNSETGGELIHPMRGLQDIFSVPHQTFPEWDKGPAGWFNISTRHLKICNVSPSTSLVVLYDILQVCPPYLRELLSGPNSTALLRSLVISKSFTRRNFSQMVSVLSPILTSGTQ